MASLLLGFGANAQDLPQPSPAATVQQRVGLTDVEINYSRPGIKGREIFGSLVPYGELWRTGANKATSISFSTDFSVEGTAVEAGTYSLFTIPTEESWTIILNKETELWGTNGYDEGKDAIRIQVRPAKVETVENLSITVENITTNSADVVVAWENTSAALHIEVATIPTAMANITAAIEESPEDARVYQRAASFYLQNEMDPKKALEYIEKSIELDGSSWYAHFLHAEILVANGEIDDAEDAAEEAIEVGEAAAKENGTEFGYTEMLQNFINGLED